MRLAFALEEVLPPTPPPIALPSAIQLALAAQN